MKEIAEQLWTELILCWTEQYDRVPNYMEYLYIRCIAIDELVYGRLTEGSDNTGCAN